MQTPYPTDPIARGVTTLALVLMAALAVAGLLPTESAPPAPVQIIATPTLGIAELPTAAPVVTTIDLIATPTEAPAVVVSAVEPASPAPVIELPAPAAQLAAPTPAIVRYAPTAVIGAHEQRPSNRPGPGDATYQTNAIATAHPHVPPGGAPSTEGAHR